MNPGLIGRLSVILVVTAGIAAVALVPDRRWAFGFVFGLGLFIASALILIEVGARMLRSGNAERPGAWLVPLLLLAKLVLLGGGCYVAIVLLDLSPIGLVVGALTTLALVTTAAAIVHKRGGNGAGTSSPV